MVREQCVYLLYCANTSHEMYKKLKIGKTNNLPRRLGQYRLSHGNVELLATLPGYSVEESRLLECFYNHRLPTKDSSDIRHKRSEWCSPSRFILEHFMSGDTLEKWCKFFGVEPGDILERKE